MNQRGPITPLGQYIRSMRKDRKLSLREFGALLGGLSPMFLSDIENEMRHPSNNTLSLMGKVFNLSVDDLKRHDNRPPIEDIKRLWATNPRFAAALRKLVDRARNA